jgi:hypothetical protein
VSHRSRVLASVSFVAALVLSACGGDDAAVTAASDLASVNSSAELPDATDESTTDTSDTTAPTDTKLGGVGGQCAEGAAVLSALGGGLGGASGATSVGDAAKNLEALKDALPTELQGDAETLSTFWVGFSKLLVKYDNDTAKLIAASASDPDVAKAVKELSTPELVSASKHLADYFSTCSTK